METKEHKEIAKAQSLRAETHERVAKAAKESEQAAKDYVQEEIEDAMSSGEFFRK